MAITTRAIAFASRWFDDNTFRRTFEPLIADWQREWQVAEPAKRTWVLIRGWCAFVCAVIVSSPRILTTPAPSAVTNRIVFRIACFTLPASVLLAIPILEIDRWGPAILLMLPGGMILAFPFAMVIAMDAIRGGEPLLPPLARALALKLGASAVVLMVVFHGWVVPAANQVWRVEMAPDPSYVPPRGVRELTTFELFVDPARATANEPYTRMVGKAGAITREKNTRAALALLPAVLLWLRWGQHERRRRRWYSPLPGSIATGIAIAGFFGFYFSGIFIESRLGLTPGTSMWLPIVTFMLLGIVERWLGNRHPPLGTPGTVRT